MTSSYNLQRRPKKRYTEWQSYAINGGVCPEGFDTVFYGQHGDWKFCVPRPHPATSLNGCRQFPNANNTSCTPSCGSGSIGSSETVNPPETAGCGCSSGSGGWQDGSANPNAGGCPQPASGWRISRATLYDDRDPANGYLYNRIPLQNRRQLHEPRAMFDRYDYYQLPTRYAGTGYEVLRGWKTPQYAEDMVDVPPVWDPRRLYSAQPYMAQQQAKRAREQQFSTLTTNEDLGVAGAFYGDPVRMN